MVHEAANAPRAALGMLLAALAVGSGRSCAQDPLPGPATVIRALDHNRSLIGTVEAYAAVLQWFGPGYAGTLPNRACTSFFALDDATQRWVYESFWHYARDHERVLSGRPDHHVIARNLGRQGEAKVRSGPREWTVYPEELAWPGHRHFLVEFLSIVGPTEGPETPWQSLPVAEEDVDGAKCIRAGRRIGPDGDPPQQYFDFFWVAPQLNHALKRWDVVLTRAGRAVEHRVQVAYDFSEYGDGLWIPARVESTEWRMSPADEWEWVQHQERELVSCAINEGADEDLFSSLELFGTERPKKPYQCRLVDPAYDVADDLEAEPIEAQLLDLVEDLVARVEGGPGDPSEWVRPIPELQ